MEARQRQIMCLLWREGKLSRWELHERTGINPNAIGADVSALLAVGILRECPAEPSGPGRPRVPLEIDPAQRHMVGIAISPGRIESARLSLRGQLLDHSRSQAVDRPAEIVPAVRAMLRDMMDDQTLSIGLSSTGFIDSDRPAILFSSALGGKGSASLSPVFEVAGDRPLVLENDMHALAARWLLTHTSESDEDVLLVKINDGQLGAALLVDGRPNRGCAIGANELGHTRFFVDTEVCYCGHAGCLERIASSAFLRRHEPASAPLEARVAAYRGDEPAMDLLLDYVSAGLANAVNFTRPNRLVLASDLDVTGAFAQGLLSRVRSRLLVELVQRVTIDLWAQPASQAAETAGWLALANLYREGWNR